MMQSENQKKKGKSKNEIFSLRNIDIVNRGLRKDLVKGDRCLTDNYIVIPQNIIVNKELGDFRVALFSYFMMDSSKSGKIKFTVKDIHDYLGRKVDLHIHVKNNITNQIKLFIKYLAREGYIEFIGDDKKYLYDEVDIPIKELIVAKCDERFITENIIYKNRIPHATLFLDEIDKVMNYVPELSEEDNQDLILDKKIKNKKNHYCGYKSLLLFAFLRLKIHTDVLGKQKFNEQIKAEAYNNYYRKMEKELGLSERLISKYVKFLGDMELIFAFQRKRYLLHPTVKSNTKFYMTPTMIFTNWYRRIKDKKDGRSYYLGYGSEYYQREVALKAKQLQKIEKAKDEETLDALSCVVLKNKK